MNFVWEDYDYNKHMIIDEWLNDDNVKKYATFDDISFNDEWSYYVNSKEYIVNKNAFCKVIYDVEECIAVVILLYYQGRLSINPIIVNPKCQNKGYGARIIKELITNIKTLLPCDIKEIYAGIDVNNVACIKMFQKCGFVLESVHPDGDFLNYIYTIN